MSSANVEASVNKKARLLALRPATQSDYEFAWKSWAEAVEPHVAPVISKKFSRPWKDEDEERRFAGWWQPRASTVIALDDLPVGWLASEEENGNITLVNLVIEKQYRRRGIASIILGAKLNEWSSKYKTVTHSVLRTSGHASFFERHGFQVKKVEDFLSIMEVALG